MRSACGRPTRSASKSLTNFNPLAQESHSGQLLVRVYRGRKANFYYSVAAFVSPLLAYIVVRLLRDKSKSAQTEPTEQLKQCRFCFEKIKLEAVTCKHCGSSLTST